MEDMRAALAAKGYDLVGTPEDDDSDDDLMPGRIRSLEPDVAREKGKAAFEKGKYDKAIKYWQGGLKSILSALCAGPEALSNTSLSELDLTLNLNIAMAYMKKEEFDAADRSVDKALARRDALPSHQITKALYRKASAQKAMNRLAETLETLKDLLEVDPTNAAALKMQQEVQREWTKQTKAQNANFKKMFSKMAGEDQKEKEKLRQGRAEARSKCGIAWTDEDVDSEAFERGDTPVCDGKDWGLALSRTTLWAMEQFATEANIFIPAESTHLSAWFLGSSSTCELRWLQPNVFMSRLPSVSTLELALIGFLGEYDPDKKRIPDPMADKMPKAVLRHRVAGDSSKNVYVRVVKGSMQDALAKELKLAADAIEEISTREPTSTEEPTGTRTDPTTMEAPANTPTTERGFSALDVSSLSEKPSEEGIEQSSPAPEETSPPPKPPNICFIAHPQLHRYFTDFYPAIAWLIRHRVPTVVIGASEPDLSWKQDEILLRALGANIVVSKRESPYPMCLPDNANVKKCNHIIGFCGGKALERDKLTRAKIDLLAQDYTVC